MEGYKTYSLVIAGVLGGVLAIFKVDVGATQEQIAGALGIIISIAIGFLRRGSKVDAASATQATVQAITGSVARANSAAETIATPNVSPVVAPVPVDLPK